MNNTSQHPEERPVFESLDQLFLQSKALAAVDSGIMITDHQARILWVNPAFSRSTGYPAEELLGMTPKVLKSGSHDASFYRQFWETVLSGETWRGEFVNRRRNGSLCVHAQTTTPMRRHSTGPITHFISVSQDITDGRKYREDWRETRTMEAFGQLAAGIAHHFNNLLTPIHANSELLLELNGDFQEESRGLVERTLEASRRAAHLIRQLAGFSQKQAPDFQALDLNRVVERTLREFLLTARGRLECECRYCASLPPILADSGMLGQVICHLLVNALDAMPKGGRLTLTTESLVLAPPDIRSHAVPRPEEFVCLTICDTGCGIPAAIQLRLFEPFFTTKDTTDRSGLGLALVDRIVKQHQGWIEVNSKVGQGTTFRIFLPAIANPIAPAEASAPGFPRRAARLLREPKSVARATFVEEPSTDRMVFPVNEVRSEPLLHWGINE
jgi:PAS domain S-box-containing protein